MEGQKNRVSLTLLLSFLVWIGEGEGDSAYLEKEEGTPDGEGRFCLQVLSPLQLGPEKAEWH